MSQVAPRGCSVVCISCAAFALLCLAQWPSHVQAAAPPQIAVPASKLPVELVRPIELAAPPAGDTGWQLRAEGAAAAVPAQLVPAMTADGLPDAKRWRVLAAIPGDTRSAAAREFRLEPSPGPAPPSAFALKDLDDKSLQLREGDRPVLVYNHGVITNEKVPEKDHRRSRACYVHPLWGLSGEVLTDDFPRDHYHHHGVFWTWPHVGVGEKHHDLWAGATIRQKFVRWLGHHVGPVAGVLGVENGWYVGDEKVMIERVWIRAYAASADARAVDFELTFIPTDKPVTLWGAEGKSYGGLTVRFAPSPGRDTVISVPDGKTKGDLEDKPLTWADFTSKFGGQTQPSGAAVFIHPRHPDYPPTWLTRHYGPLCVGWPGIKPKTFAPGEPIRLDYRIWIHKAAGDVEQLKAAYAGYVAAVAAPK